MRIPGAGWVFVLAAVCWPVPGTKAAPGDIDPSFGTGGVAPVSMAPDDLARALVVQPGGMIVVAGRIGSHFGLSRRREDGSLHTTFGTAGYASTVIDDRSSDRGPLTRPPDASSKPSACRSA